ncbi:MAG: ABC transporter ATP-binding protein [Motiliproteus sp.]
MKLILLNTSAVPPKEIKSMLMPVLAEGRWRWLSALITIGLAQSAALLGLVYIVRQLTASGATGISIVVGVQALLLVSVLALGRFGERYIAELLAQRYVRDLRYQVFRHAMNLSLESADSINKGGTLLRLTGDMGAIRNWIVQGLSPLLVLGAWLLVAIIGLATVHSYLLMAFLLPLLVAVGGNYGLGQLLYRESGLARKRRGQLIRNTTEKLREQRLIQTFNQQGREGRRFALQGDRLFSAQITRAKVSGWIRGFNEWLLGLSILLLILVGFNLVVAKELALEDLGLVLGASFYLLSHLRRLGRLYEYWTLNTVAVHKLEDFFAKDTIAEKRRRRLKGVFQLTLKKAEVAGRFVPISASVDHRSRILLQGPQGSGKTSMLMTMAGLVPLTAGSMRINGVLVQKLGQRQYSQQVALVSAELPLLRGTLRKNLFYGARKQDADFSEEILELCGLRDWIDQLPDGMSTGLLESGSNLSAGVRYRIMLARALLRRPSLLLLDQDQALQDAAIEAMLQQVFERFEGAIVAASALPSLQGKAQQLWCLDEKLVVVKSLDKTDQDKQGSLVRLDQRG